ncbi:MAG: mismatch repair protein MutS [Pseudomonadota bacterium]|jgi:DNA mismatch repair protein MutS
MTVPHKKSDLPPMMQRYLETKEQYPDALLFFQVGDFYELFFDDAVVVAKTLNLTLTSRDKNAPNPIPMCGVPLSVLDGYIDRLLPMGHSIAVVTQTGSGSGVERALERFITPAMRLFTSVSSDSSESVLAAVALEPDNRSSAIACTDPQTGVVRVKDSLEVATLAKELANISAREVILPRSSFGEKVDRRSSWVRSIEGVTSSHAVKFRTEVAASPELAVSLSESACAEFHALSPTSKRAVRLLLSYLDEVSLGNAISIREVTPIRTSGCVIIDAATRKNLELVQNTKDGSSVGTLFGFLNSNATPGGARLLRSWILAPLDSRAEIVGRQDAVRDLIPHASVIASILSGLSDLERLAARVELKVASPKDLGAIRDTLERIPALGEVLAQCDASLLATIASQLALPEGVLEHLKGALVDSPPHVTNDGGVIRVGYDEELDGMCAIRSQADTWRAAFEAREKATTGITNLKVKSNNIIGYFLEIPTSQSSKAPPHYIRRQSTANADRFTTPELKTHEDGVVTAVDRQVRREQLLFTALRDSLVPIVGELRRIASAMATVDVLASLSATAQRHAWVRPELTEDATLSIRKGRHPIIASLLDGGFIPNSVNFSDEGGRCFIVTGPNMGGKSTYLRQTALIVVLAQIGSYVPAESAVVGLVDRIFARLGASDDLHEGESTFMVEMREASHILSHASHRSLVLIDELGRGTATTDGQSLAQAILEHLALTVACRTLFATHYHEITALSELSSKIKNLSVGSVEDGDRVVFTHEIQEGPAPRSYGIEVAKLSGLPNFVIERASDILSHLGEKQRGRAPITIPVRPVRATQDGGRQPSLFDAAPQVVRDVIADRVKARVKELDVDTLSPRDALQYLYSLKEIVQG